MDKKFYLYKSGRKDKKYRMDMPSYGHKHHFGAKGMRDYTLINDKTSKHYLPKKEDREKVRKAYRSRHRNDKGLGNIHSPAELSMVILWSEPTLDKGIRAFEKKHKVKIVKKF